MGILFDGASGISATGNIVGNYILGNGSQLTGIGGFGATGPQGPQGPQGFTGATGPAGGGNGTAIINGTSTVDIATANGNISMAVAGSNVMLVSDTQIETTVAVVAPAIYATEAILYNSNQITGEQTLPANYNGLSAGDITITNSGNVNLSTSNWVIV